MLTDAERLGPLGFSTVGVASSMLSGGSDVSSTSSRGIVKTPFSTARFLMTLPSKELTERTSTPPGETTSEATLFVEAVGRL